MTSLNHPTGETVHSLSQRESLGRLRETCEPKQESREHPSSESLFNPVFNFCEIQKISGPLLRGSCYFPIVIYISRNPSYDGSALEHQLRTPQLGTQGPRVVQDPFPYSSMLEYTK